MGFDFFFTLSDDIFVLSLNSVVISSKLSQSKFVVSSLIKPILDFSSQFFSCISKLVSQLLAFVGMIGIAVLELASQGVHISLIQFSNLDLVELNFSLVVLNDILDFMLEFVVVFFD
jgi:hypothetical protein